MIKRILLYILAGLILYASWLMLLLSLPYTSFKPHVDFLMTKQLVYHLRLWRVSFYTHVFVSILVLLTGLLQFNWYLLKKYPGVHRTSGKIYVLIVLLFSGPSGLIMGFYANGGLPARISFVILATLWMVFTYMGWRYTLQRNWQKHAAMLIRSYALTLSALTLRFYAFLIGTFHIPLHPVNRYILISWLSWTLNLLIAEAIIKWGFEKINRSFPAKSAA
ncbi:DUF2306 domain-containing protein [Chitinophaga oryziterrae]